MATKSRSYEDDSSPTSGNGAVSYNRSSSGVQSGTGPSGKQKVGHTTLDANNEPQKFKKLELENLQRSIQHAILMIISNEELYKPERQLLMADLEKVVIININGSDVPRDVSSSNSPYLSGGGRGIGTPGSAVLAQEDRLSVTGSVRGMSVSNFRFKAYAPRAFDFFRKIYKVELTDFMKSIGDRMKCIPNPGASGSLFFITGDDCFIMKTLQKKEAVFLLQLYPGYILNLYQSPDTLLPKYFGCFCYQSALGKNVRVAIMNNLIPRNVTLWRKYDLKGSTYKRRTDASKSSSKVPTLKDLNFKEDFGNHRILLDSDIYKSLIDRLENDTLMLMSFEIMDYSFLMAIEEVDMEKEREATLRPENDNVPSFYQYSEILNLSSLRHQKGIPAIREKDGKHLRLYVGIIDILQKYVFKKRLEHHMKAVFLESHDSEVSVTHPNKYQRRFMDFMKNEVFKENPIGSVPTHPSMYYSAGKSGRSLPNPKMGAAGASKFSSPHSAVSATLPTSDGAPPSTLNVLHPSQSREFDQQHRRSTNTAGGPMTRVPPNRLSPVASSDSSGYSASNSGVTPPGVGGVHIHAPGGSGQFMKQSISTTSYQYTSGGSDHPPQSSSSYHRPSSEISTPHRPPTGRTSNITGSSTAALQDRPGSDSGYRSSTTSASEFSPSNRTGAPSLAKQESLSMFNTELDEGYMEFSRTTAANSSSYSYSSSNRSHNINNNNANSSKSNAPTPNQHSSNSYVGASSTKLSPGPNWKPHKETPLPELNSSRLTNGSSADVTMRESSLMEDPEQTRVYQATVVELQDDEE